MKTEEIVIIVVTILVSFLLIGSFSGVGYGSSGMMGMMSGAYGFGGMWLFGWLFMILITIALVLGIIWLIKQIQK